ncbi:MAG TPA: hypothetical protein VM537_36780 [Anaerolineae bacterium]|nr:hypothetical protein [Anaerolineae bacterium]
MRRGRSGLLTVLLIAVAVLAVVGLVLVGVYLFLRAQPQLANGEPQGVWDSIGDRDLNPPLALRPLAGEASADSLQAALTVGDLDAARATLVHSPSFSDAERLGYLLLLTQRYAETGDQGRAASCLGQAQALIVLSPLLSDLGRADAALQASMLWHFLERDEDALVSIEQAQVVIEGSGRLRPAQRQDLWQRLAAGYGDLGLEEEAMAVSKAADRRAEPPAQVTLAPIFPGFLGSPPVSLEVEQAQAARQQRAVVLIEQWIALDGEDLGPEVSDLAEFLRREDAARSTYLAEGMTGVAELSAQAAAAREQVVWLTLKYRTALGGFGLSIVPEWEEDAPLIRSELTKAYESLFRLYGDQATALPNAADVDRAWVELLRQEILAGTLELYPDYPHDTLVERLLEAQERLQASGSTGFWVTMDTGTGGHSFALQGPGGE